MGGTIHPCTNVFVIFVFKIKKMLIDDEYHLITECEQVNEKSSEIYISVIILYVRTLDPFWT